MPSGLPSSAFQLIDPSNVREVFSDSLGQALFDGQTLRLEFCVVRFDSVEASATAQKKPTGKRHVVARLVLDTEGAVELVNQCMKFVAVMEQRGLIKRNPPAETAPKSPAQGSN